MVCEESFRKDDIVDTVTMFTQIQHAKCFIYIDEYIKDTGKNEEILNKYPRYKKALIRMGFCTPDLSNSKMIGTPAVKR